MKLIKTFSKTSVVAPSVFQITSRRQKVQHSNSVDLEHDILAMFRILIHVYLFILIYGIGNDVSFYVIFVER